MGSEYARWLVAKGNVFLPSSAAVAKLIEHLRSEGWIVDPERASTMDFTGARDAQAKATGGYAVKSIENEFGANTAAKVAASTEAQPAEITPAWLDAADREEIRLVWPVVSGQPLPVKYPLVPAPEGEVAYTLEVHRAPEYVYPVAKNIGAIPTECACGEDLSFEWDEDEVVAPFDASTGIFAECDECSRTFDPSKGSAAIGNPFDGTKERLPGGAAYRFALKFESIKGLVADPRLSFDPALVALVEKEFGRAFYEFGCVTGRSASA